MKAVLSIALRHALLVVFFGYAAYANASMILTSGGLIGDQKISTHSVITGETARAVESIYEENLPLRNAVIDIVGAARYLIFNAGRYGVVPGRDGWLFTEEEIAESGSGAAVVSDVVSRIQKISTKLKADGTLLMMVPLPAKADIYSMHLPARFNHEEMRERYRLFTKKLSEAGVAVVSNRDLLADHVKRDFGEPVFMKSDTHWTPRGAQLVAGQVAEYTKSLSLDLEPVNVAVKSFERIDVQGDLSRFVTSSYLAQYVGLRSETVHAVRAAVDTSDDALDLFGTSDNFDVVLVGTSYSANTNWAFADHLSLALQADVLNMAEEGQGPGHPMMAFLRNEEFRNTPPRLVIWEFPVRYLTLDTLWQHDADTSDLSADLESVDLRPAS